MGKVYIKKTKDSYDYEMFMPSDLYPEGLCVNLHSDQEIYNDIRELLAEMGLDKKNFGKKNWNPFGDFIKKGDNVVIKPNLVFHQNKNFDFGSMDSLITNFSVIRPIIDYTIIALGGTGKITLGDAPVQECEFEKVIEQNGLKEALNIYNKEGYLINLVDFRKNSNDKLECIEVKLNDLSSFKDIDRYYKKFSISNYNLKIMREHHNEEVHEYCFPKEILEANVIINIPKPKTHKIAGITACMKNFFGANAKKEYLPHHRDGNIHNNGDEYPEKSFIKLLCSKIKNYTYLKNKFINLIKSILFAIRKILKKNKYQKGMWYGNDTIWRTILDVNKAILYSDDTGKIATKKQRIVFNIADMVVCGEKEGPLKPNDKKVGLLVAGFNQLDADYVICKLMGFDPNKIKYIPNGYKLKKLKISNLSELIISDGNVNIKNLSKYKTNFIASDGWYEYLNKK